MLEKFKRLGKESIIYGLGGAGSKFISFILLPLYSRIFSVGDYGAIDVIAVILLLAGVLLVSGTETAESYFFFEYREPQERKKTITALGVYIFLADALVALMLFLISDTLSKVVLGDIYYAPYLRLASITLPFTGLHTFNLNLMRLRRKPFAYISVTLPFLLFTILCNLLLVLVLRVGIVGIFWTNIIAAVVFSILGIFINREYWGWQFDVQRFKEMFHYWIPLALVGICSWMMVSMDRIFLSHFSSLEQVGLYAAALRIASLMGFFTQAFRTANLPFIFETAKEKDAPQVYSRTLSYFLLLSSMLLVPLSLFARSAIILLATQTYERSAMVVPIIAALAIADGVAQIVSVGVLITRRTAYVGVVTAICALLNIVLLYSLIQVWGMLGAAAAVFLTYLIYDIIILIKSQQVYPAPYESNRISKIILIAGSIILIGMWIAPENIWSNIMVATGLSVLYYICILVFHLVTPREREVLLDYLKKFRGIVLKSG